MKKPRIVLALEDTLPVQITIRVSPEAWRRLRRAAIARGVGPLDFVLNSLKEGLAFNAVLITNADITVRRK